MRRLSISVSKVNCHNRSGHVATLVGLFCFIVIVVLGLSIAHQLGVAEVVVDIADVVMGISLVLFCIIVAVVVIMCRVKRVAEGKRPAAISSNDPGYERAVALSRKVNPEARIPTPDEYHKTIMGVGRK